MSDIQEIQDDARKDLLAEVKELREVVNEIAKMTTKARTKL